MGRKRNPNRDKAFDLYQSYDGSITIQDLANELVEQPQIIRNWKSQDKWDEQLGISTKRGVPKGYKNAKGNTGGAKPGNQNARKLGLYSKYLPPQLFNIADEIAGLSDLDKLWNNIQILNANLLHAQKLLFVKDSMDHTKTVKRIKPSKNNPMMLAGEIEYDIQYSWDKQSNALTTMSKVMRDISRLVREYEELLHKNWDLATEEQKTRIEVLKSKIPSEDETKEDKLDKYFEMLEKSYKNA